MTDNQDDILIDQRDHILLATLNRPEIHNAMSHHSMIEAIVALCERVNSDPQVRVVVLTGAGKSFCAGGNIKDMRDKSHMFAGDAATVEQGYKQGIQRVPLALWNLEVPVIAAVNGAAIGAGCDMAMMCDIRIAASKASFAESFVKLGIIPGDGGAWFLPRVVGMARANQMALTGMSVSAEQAMDWGLVAEVTAPEALLPRALSLAEAIAANPPLAVRATKKLLRASARSTLPEMLDQCARVQAGLHQTADHSEAVSAFLEKRPGHYRGK